MAILLSFAILAYFFIVGNAILIYYKYKYDDLTVLLLSPVIGLVLFISIIFIISKFGFPLKDIAKLLAILLFIVSVILLIYKKYYVSYKNIFILISLTAICYSLTGHSLFVQGFDWIGVANDDMTNYALGAQRFLSYGYFQLPDIDVLKKGIDYSQSFWVLHSPIGVRSGSELLLSALWSVTGIDALKIFMPVTLALQVIQIFAAASLLTINSVNKNNNQIKLALVFLIVSPLITLGTILQLIGQVGGLAILCASFALFLRFDPINNFNYRVFKTYSDLFPRVLIIFGLIVWYPETLPIFALALLIYLLINKIILKVEIKNYLIELILIGSIVIFALGSSLASGFNFLVYQIFYGSSLQETSTEWSALLFPYYLLPSGIAVIWGLLPLSSVTPEPENSTLIVVGYILTLWTVFSLFKKNLKEYASICSILITFFILGISLFKTNNGFGLFKLAMFMAPFLLCLFAININKLKFNGIKRIFYLLPIAFILLNINVINSYISMGSALETENTSSNSFNLSEIKIAKRYIEFIDKIKPTLEKDAVLISETSDMFLVKLQALYTRGVRIYFPTADYFLDRFAALGLNSEDFSILKSSQQYKDYEVNGIKFKLLNYQILDTKNIAYISDTNRIDVFNKFYKNNDGTIFQIDKDPKNRLIFINSSEGVNYRSLYRKKSAFYLLEKDSGFPGDNFTAFNKKILTEVINPTPNARLILSLTNTPTSQFNYKLPSPTLNNKKINIVGSGSARIYSAPIDPVSIDGHNLLFLDMNREGKPFGQQKSLLMNMFGKDVLLDSRYLTTFVRDFSVVSNENYEKLNRPSSISKFPTDLENVTLEYSGIYENGDLSESSYVFLNSNSKDRYLILKAQVPAYEVLAKSPISVNLYLDGSLILKKTITNRELNIMIPINAKNGVHKIEITFDGYPTSQNFRFLGPNIKYLGFQ